MWDLSGKDIYRTHGDLYYTALGGVWWPLFLQRSFSIEDTIFLHSWWLVYFIEITLKGKRERRVIVKTHSHTINNKRKLGPKTSEVNAVAFVLCTDIGQNWSQILFLLWMYKQLCTEMAKLMKKKMYTKKCHTEKKLNVSLLNRGIECKPGLHGHRPLNSQWMGRGNRIFFACCKIRLHLMLWSFSHWIPTI